MFDGRAGGRAVVGTQRSSPLKTDALTGCWAPVESLGSPNTGERKVDD